MFLLSSIIVVVQSISCCDTMSCSTSAFLSFTVSQSLLKFMSIESVIVSNHLNLCHPLLLPSVFLSIRVFSSESVLHIWRPKYWSFSVSPSNEYSGLISFRIDWFNLLAVQGNLENTNSLALSLLSGPTLTSVCDYWKNRSFDYTDLCRQ